MFIFIVRVFVFRSELNSPDSDSNSASFFRWEPKVGAAWCFGGGGGGGGGGVSADVT